MLDGIAREKVRSLRRLNQNAQIEVYLACQVQLRERLQLRRIAPETCASSTSPSLPSTTLGRDVSAEQIVGEFADYLATRWQARGGWWLV
ncbi:NEL domain-containing protein [Bradyrhizobium sp. WSM3983]|uniref:NEL domain-containing protein n=1 Tax=Bradyrhizobium sp. WSM3983 TaxID=1038867 RepID=UPI001FD8E570|nr:NEL domain-containing protein [Bradyrhizobium sp. WSM3983]